MKIKITILVALFLALTLGVIGKSNAQTVIAVATNSNCPDQGKIVTNTSGFAAPIVGYQLKQGVNVVRPIGGSGFQASNEFLGLPAGTYTVVADDGNTIRESDPVTVTINYIPITAAVAPVSVTCGATTTSLTVTASGGSADLRYAITPTSQIVAPAIGAFQVSPTFSNLGVGEYKFWIKDNGCTTATVINTTGSVNLVAAPDVAAYGLSVLPSLSFASPNNYLSGYRVSIGRFTRGATAMSAAEATSYTVEVMDGALSVAGPVAVSAGGGTNVPVPNGLVGHALTVILKNTCTGNTKTFAVSQLGPEMNALATCPGAQAMYRIFSYSLVALPATITYVNQDGTGNGNQIIVRNFANDSHNYVNFPPGNFKFDWKVVDAAGEVWTGEHDFTTSLIVAPTQWNSYINNCALRQGTIELVMRGVKNSTPIRYEILEAPVGSEALIGHQDNTQPGWKNDYTLLLNGQTYFPKGRYKIKFIDEGCHNGREMVVNANGNEATVTGITKTPNCGSFDFKINGTFGTGFEQYIISGPAGTAGLIKTNTETFTSLPYGTYKVGLRIRNASCNIFEETFTYTAESSIDFDALNSGGFTCIAGGKGDLHIVASTTMPGAILEYSINGVDFQTSNIFTNLNEGSYNVTIRENKCGSLRTVNVAVISNINATINNQVTSTVVCEGAPVALNINAIGGIKYTWTYPDGTQHIGKVQNFANATPSMAGKYSVVVEAGSCTTVPQEVILKVTTKPIVAPIAAQTACAGIEKTIAITGSIAKEFSSATSSIDLPTSYVWTNDNTTIGLAANGTGSITFIPVNATLSPILANIKVKPVGATGCDGTEINFSITVNPNATLTLTSAVATTTQTKCINVDITPITYKVENGTNATVTGLPAGVTGAFANGIFTINGAATVAGAFNYTVTTVSGCTNTETKGTLTINPLTTIVLTSTVASTNQIININTPIAPITYKVENGGTGATVTGLPNGVSGSFTAGIFTISGTPTVAGTFNYQVTTTGGCEAASLSGQITVNADATITLTSAFGTDKQIICINTPIVAINYALTNATDAIITGLPNGLQGSYTSGAFNITGTPTVAGIFNYEITVTGPGASATAKGSITVNPDVVISLSSAAATNQQNICVNTKVADITYVITNGTAAMVTGLPTGLSGVYNDGIFTISGNPTVSGTFNYVVTATGACKSAIASGQIKVNPDVSISLTTGTNVQNICINQSLLNTVYTITNGSSATVTGLPSGVTGVYSNGEFTISGTPTIAGIFNYTLTAEGDCAPASINGTLIVDPDVSIIRFSAVSTDAQDVCINRSITTITYQIDNATSANVTGLPAGVTSVFSNGTLTITGIPSVIGSYNFTITAVGKCASKTINGTITVAPDVSIQLTSASNEQTLCINTMLTPITYNIANATNASITGLPQGVMGTYNNGVFTISGTPTTAGLFSYQITATGACAFATVNGKIIVNPNASISLSSIVGSDSQNICINSALSTLTYTISNSTNVAVTGLPEGVTGTYANGVLVINGTPTVAGSFNYTITATGGCASATLMGTITVIPNVGIQLNTANDVQNKCTGVAIANITYTIINDGIVTIIGLPQGIKGTFNAGVFTISGSSTQIGTFNYVITVTGTCNVVTAKGTITINALPVGTLTSDIGLTVSKGDVVTLTATGGTTYTWIGNDIISGQGTNTVKVRPRQSETYKVLITNANGCSTELQITLNIVDDYKLIPNNVITPNGDGKNDTWVVKNIDYYPNNTVSIYDRAGRKLYSVKGYKNDWDGTYNGMPLAEAAYVYIIDSGKGIGLIRGTINIIRDQR